MHQLLLTVLSAVAPVAAGTESRVPQHLPVLASTEPADTPLTNMLMLLQDKKVSPPNMREMNQQGSAYVRACLASMRHYSNNVPTKNTEFLLPI